MLLSLAIRDIVLIEKLDIDWHPALCALTGETGAGKSILLDALGLAIGARGNTGLVRAGAARGSVVAVFAPSSDHPVRDILRENDLVVEGCEVILRRVQMRDGRTRAFCNDMSINAGLLRQIGDALVEIHGQNETQSLTSEHVQLHLLDRYGRLESDALAVRRLHSVWSEGLTRLADHRVRAVSAQEELLFLRDSCIEFDTFAPQVGEEALLASERSVLLNAEKISSDLDLAVAVLGGNDTDGVVEGNMRSQLSGALLRLERVSEFSGGRLDVASSAIARALIEFDEAAAQVSAAREAIIAAPSRLAQVEDRLFALRGLARKHHVSCDDLPSLGLDLTARLTVAENADNMIERLESECAQMRDAWYAEALVLSKARRGAAQALDRRVNLELEPLKITGGQFSTQFTALTESAGASGLERVSFLASTNPGTPLAPISKIASGGELARFMLALKVALERGLDSDESERLGSEGGEQIRQSVGTGVRRTLIFDEVDSGVGGAVAYAVGERLRALSDYGQILVVTHSPQVAAASHHHWQVLKSTQCGQNVTNVSYLDSGTRIEEVARMLAGQKVSDEARAAAQKLLEDNG